MPEREEATTTADTLYRHGDPDPSVWQEAEVVTDRPNDTPLHTPPVALENSTFGSRAATRQAPTTKAVDATEAENKAVSSAATKTTTRRRKAAG